MWWLIRPRTLIIFNQVTFVAFELKNYGMWFLFRFQEFGILHFCVIFNCRIHIRTLGSKFWLTPHPQKFYLVASRLWPSNNTQNKRPHFYPTNSISKAIFRVHLIARINKIFDANQTIIICNVCLVGRQH